MGPGTVLNQLPRMFLGFSKLLVTAWHHEAAIIPVSNILHVNAALQYSSVLIQAYGVLNPAKVYIAPFPFEEHPSNSDGIVEFHQFKNNCFKTDYFR